MIVYLSDFNSDNQGIIKHIEKHFKDEIFVFKRVMRNLNFTFQQKNVRLRQKIFAIFHRILTQMMNLY